MFGKEIKIVVAERRSPNNAPLLFVKSGFTRERFKVGTPRNVEVKVPDVSHAKTL